MFEHRHQGDAPVARSQQHNPMFSAHKAAGWLAVLATLITLLAPLPAARAATASSSGPQLTASVPSGQPVGTSIAWTAKASGLAHPVYGFSIGPAKGKVRVVQDYSPSASFTWVPLQEGAYTVQVTAKDGFAATGGSSAAVVFAVTSRVKGSSAVVSKTANPLVALYSAPACTKGTLVVQYRPADSSAPWASTAAQPCHAGQSVNVLVAGMRPSTAYTLRHVVAGGTPSVSLTFTTGKPEAGLKLTTFTVKQPMTGPADLPAAAIFQAISPTADAALANPVAVDLAGHLVWYYDTLHSSLTEVWPTHILAGGTTLLLGQDSYHKTGEDVLREIDLAGDVLRQTNIDSVNAQLAHLGTEPIYGFHHDAMRLPNGYTAVLGMTQRHYDGHNVMSDMLVVLDTNLQVVWAWDYFDHFTPPATFPPQTGTCGLSGKVCGLPDPKAIDWTHGNGIGWSPADGNLILSFRGTSWVIKVAYQNGHGTGKVLWRLGKDGDFTIHSSDPYPWFSQQHNATYVSNTQVAIFDDGNTRCENGKVRDCESRGQVYQLDEQRRVATLQLNANVGKFFQAQGSTQELPGGDTFYAAGYPPDSKEVQIRPNGSVASELNAPVAVYRAYWTPTLSS
jgi:hypothetical protein